MSAVVEWSIHGADGEPIIGDCHLPPANAKPRGVILIAHGFKGYKDYGMFPRIAVECANAGFIAHRFNFSHSGMTNRIETFERPDLFERDTSNKQVFDLRAVVDATSQGELIGQGLPYVMFGHSRGGVTVLLTAGRFANDPMFPQPVGLITAAAPSSCNPLAQEEAGLLLKQGWIESPSSRTGQKLRIGKASLQEQLDDPAAHDVLELIREVRCPILIIHGDADQSVPVACAEQIAFACGKQTTLKIIPGADHVFNTPNPMAVDVEPSPQLQQLIQAILGFMDERIRKMNTGGQ